jgi:hypothetical protein
MKVTLQLHTFELQAPDNASFMDQEDLFMLDIAGVVQAASTSLTARSV